MDSALQKKRNKNIDFIRNTYHSSLEVVACWCPSSFTRLIPAESAKRKKRKEIFSEILCMVHTLRLRYFHHIAISGWASNVHIFSCVWNGFREIQQFRELTWLRQFSKWNQRSRFNSGCCQSAIQETIQAIAMSVWANRIQIESMCLRSMWNCPILSTDIQIQISNIATRTLKQAKCAIFQRICLPFARQCILWKCFMELFCIQISSNATEEPETTQPEYFIWRLTCTRPITLNLSVHHFVCASTSLLEKSVFLCCNSTDLCISRHRTSVFNFFGWNLKLKSNLWLGNLTIQSVNNSVIWMMNISISFIRFHSAVGSPALPRVQIMKLSTDNSRHSLNHDHSERSSIQIDTFPRR